MKIKLYDFIFETFENYEGARNSDKKLAWYIWSKQGVIKDGRMSLEGFLDATSFSSIVRARRKVVEHHPHLCPTDKRVVRNRNQIQRQRGTQAYRDNFEVRKQEIQEALFN